MNNDVSRELEAILKDYEVDVTEAVEKAATKASKNMVDDLKRFDDFKTHTRDYSKGWTRKKTNNGYVVYNKTHPQLTHLLENGHLVSNQYGSFGAGRRGAVPHIASRERRHVQEFINEIKKGI